MSVHSSIAEVAPLGSNDSTRSQTSPRLVVLTDDRGLQPAENVIPLVRSTVLARYGSGVLAILNAVSAHVSTPSQRASNAQMEMRGENPRLVAGSWLHMYGLASMGAVQ